MVDSAEPPTRAVLAAVPPQGSQPKVRRARRLAVLAGLMVILAGAPGAAESTTTAPPSSESSDTTAPPDPSTTDDASTPGTAAPTTAAAGSSSEERQRLEAAKAENARELNVADAQLDDVTAALATLQDQVRSQSTRVELAGKRLVEAQAVADAAEAELAELEADVAALEADVGHQAVQEFKGDNLGGAIMVSQDPNRALRMQTMLAKATRSDIDLVSTLDAAHEDLRLRRRTADEALGDAERLRLENEEQLAALQRDQQAQARVAAEAEQRLDHLLSERAGLAQLGEELDTGSEIEQALVTQLNQVPDPPAPEPDPEPSEPPAQVGQGTIQSAGKGIMVHVDIVDEVRQLLADSAAAGIDLAGGGYRDPAAQIATRRNNCGTSNYAIYQMPASSCSPPTARPGQSMHEQGKAIDFTCSGSLIRSRSGSCWNWLAANAARYGLQNLPSEPWHWSTNGR